MKSCFIQRIGRAPKDGENVSCCIVTIGGGSCYDKLYSQIPQTAPDGVVKVFSLKAEESSLMDFCDAIQGLKETHDLLREIREDANNPDVDIIINFECCSKFSGYKFNIDHEVMNRLFYLVKERKWLLQFADYSTKALARCWPEDIFGPNPIKSVSTFSGKCSLRFEAETLRKCKLTQLQVVGELAEDEKVSVMAISGTVVFTLTPAGRNALLPGSSPYNVELLTIQNDWGKGNPIGLDEGDIVSIKDHSGAVGHVLVTFPSKGEKQFQILISSTHWIELLSIDTSVEAVVRQSKARYGSKYSKTVEKELSSYTTTEERDKALKKYTKCYVTSAASRNGGYCTVSTGLSTKDDDSPSSRNRSYSKVSPKLPSKDNEIPTASIKEKATRPTYSTSVIDPSLMRSRYTSWNGSF